MGLIAHDTLMLLADEQQALDDLYAMDDGEVTPDHEALEQELAARLVTKTDAFGAYVRDKEGRADIIKQEIDRLAARKRALDNQVARLKNYAAAAMHAMQRTKLEGQLFTVALQNNPAAVVVNVPPESLPPAFVRTVPEKREPDKNAIKAALKRGETINGCELVTTQSLRIR